MIKGSLDLVTELRQAHHQVLAQSKKMFDMDEEDLEQIKEELAKVGNLASQVMEVTGQLCDIFKDAAFETVRDNA